jgi:hypothetical protein
VGRGQYNSSRLTGLSLGLPFFRMRWLHPAPWLWGQNDFDFSFGFDFGFGLGSP